MRALKNITITKDQVKQIKEKIINIHYAVENEDNEEILDAPTYQKARKLKKELEQINKEENIEETLKIVKHIETQTNYHSVY